jgi:hypothetical protein
MMMSKKLELTELEKRVLRYLADHGGFVHDEISAGELGLDLEAYRAVCASLSDKGLVELESSVGMHRA